MTVAPVITLIGFFFLFYMGFNLIVGYFFGKKIFSKNINIFLFIILNAVFYMILYTLIYNYILDYFDLRESDNYINTLIITLTVLLNITYPVFFGSLLSFLINRNYRTVILFISIPPASSLLVIILYSFMYFLNNFNYG